MAVRRKPKAVKAKVRTRKRKSQAGLWVLLGLVALAVGLAALVLKNREEPLKPLSAQIAQSFGQAGAGAGDLASPRTVAVDAQGNAYVVDLGNSRVNKYGPDGAFLLSWGRKGENPPKAKPGEFNEPSGVAVNPSGHVLVADAWNGRVQEFTGQGKFVAEYGGAHYSFYSPRNVACDRQGDFYVADTGNSKVQAFSAAGTLLKVLGGNGHSAGQFSEVFGLALNSRGEIYAADPGNQRINHYSALPEGKFLGERKVAGWRRSAPFWPQLAVDASDRVYATDAANRQVWVYDADLKYLGTLGGQPGKEYFSSPVGLAFTPAGELLVVDKDKNSVVRIRPLSFPVFSK
jgi:DNA-binding beta-propeller fold protein YncE